MAFLRLFLATFIVVYCSLDSSAIDLTLQSGADGPLVVQATIAKFDSAFASDSVFWDVSHSNIMRIIAYAESLDTAPTANQGGIQGLWGITIGDFYNSIRNHYAFDQFASQIVEEFRTSEVLNITYWNEATDSEGIGNMDVPLYSCINARLRLLFESIGSKDICHFDNENFPSNPSEADFVDKLADYWYACYRDGNSVNAVEHKNIFKLRYNALLEDSNAGISRCIVNTDLAFVLDSSGSIGAENWELVRNYVREVTASIEERTVGDENVEHRVAIIRFSTDVFVDISLDSDQGQLQSIIDNLVYIGDGTNTHLALQQLLHQPWDDTALRIVIVLTDGHSNDQNATLLALDELNMQESLTIFVTGVADVDEAEVLAIASSEMTYSYIETFQDTSALARTLNQQAYRICFTATTMVDFDGNPMQYDKFASGTNARFQYAVPTETSHDGFTLRLCNEQGHVRLYGSFSIPNPNPALSDFILDAVTNGQECEDVYITFKDPSVTGRKKRQVSSVRSVYVSVEGVANSSSFTIETEVGNTVQFAVTCDQNPCGINTVCTNSSGGGYTCDCLPGHKFGPNIVDCVDVNECEFLTSPCSQFAACTNTNGSFECACLPGYTGNGLKCIIEQNTQHRFIVTVACGAGGGLLALVVVLAALIKICKVTRAHKDSKYHRTDDRNRPSDAAGLTFTNPAAISE